MCDQLSVECIWVESTLPNNFVCVPYTIQTAKTVNFLTNCFAWYLMFLSVIMKRFCSWLPLWFFYLILTLNCIRYPALPLVHNGGSMEPPQRKPLSHRIFKIIFTPYVYTLITTIFLEKKYKIFVPFQNGGQKTDFSFRVILISAKIWKTTFPKEFFNEIWLKLGDHEYINIAEIIFG